MNEDNLKLELKHAIELFVEGMMQIDVTDNFISAFLKATEVIQLPKEERLRQLAIVLENEKFTDGWKGLLRIYDAALQENPTDLDIYHSIGVSAGEWCEDWKEPDLAKRKAATVDGKAAVTEGLKLDPKDGDLSYVMGSLFYNEPFEGEAERVEKNEIAYHWFCRAVEVGAAEIAKLYRAHCLHDLHRWDEAIVAYESVNQLKLELELATWRVYKLKEQIAYCYAQAGQQEKSITLFLDFIDEISHLARDEDFVLYHIVNLFELVEAVTKILHDDELLRRTRELVKQLKFEFLYEEKLALK